MSEVIQGDCLEVLADFPDGEFDLIYVDPPFFTGRDWGEFDDRWESLDQYVEWVKVRAEQWHRVLKPTGSFYLHCDDTANAYLRLVCDVIFGRKNFKNEIIWKRTAGKSNSKKFGRVHDTILYYAGKGATWNTQYLPHRQEYVDSLYNKVDERGRWRPHDLLATGTSDKRAVQTWRGIDPPPGRRWSAPTKGGMSDWIKENVLPDWPEAYPTIFDKLDALDAAGLIYWPAKEGGMPGRKSYLSASRGVAVEDIFSDIKRLESQSREKVGYPTQKPVALLERLIRASTNAGDSVLDPMCGSGTTLLAARKLGRNYVGIDANPKAVQLAKARLAPPAQVEIGLYQGAG